MLLFVDSMSHYTQPFMDKKWDVVSDPYAVGPTPSSTPVTLVQAVTGGRFGAGGVAFDSPNILNYNSVAQANDGQYIQRNYSGVGVVVTGMAVLQLATQITNGARLLTFLDSATTQVGIDIMPSGQLRAVRSTSAGMGIFLASFGTSFAPGTYTELGTSTDAISSSSYDFLEVKVTHHPSAGIIEIKRNGAAFWTLSNVNTAVSGVNTSSSVLVGGYGAVWTANLGTLQAHYLRATISDFYLLNTTAGGTGDPVDFIGDRHWEPLFPLVDVTTDWTADPGPDNFANINTVPPDDTRNNNTETINAIDNYEFESALGPDAATMMFSYTMYLEKNTGGAVGISGQSVSNAMPANGTEFQVPNPYAFRQSFGFIDPNTSAAWTVAAFNLANHGYERTS